MALVFSGGPIVDTTFNLGTITKKLALFEGVRDALAAAGWTITTALPSQVLTVNNNGFNVSDGETITLLGKVYTFKTTINNANDGEILIAGTGVDSYLNFIAGVNLTAGAGTTYSSATTAGLGTITSQELGGTSADTLTFTANSESDAGGAVSETLVWGSWATGTRLVAGFDAESAETPDYLTCRLGISYSGEGSNVDWVLYNRDKSASEIWVQTAFFGYTNNADQRIIANKYGFWCFKPGAKGDDTAFGAQVLSIPLPMRCKKIIAATNATPIAITTNVPHGYTTGQQVKQQYVEGNTAANGIFSITVTGPSTYTCTGTVGNGEMTGIRGVVGSITSGYREIFEFAIGLTAMRSGSGVQFRETLALTSAYSGQTFVFNGANYAGNYHGVSTVITNVFEDGKLYPWYNDAVLMDSPIIAISEDDGLTWKLAGQLYDTAILRQSIPMDQPIVDESGNSWLTLTDNYASGTFMIKVG